MIVLYILWASLSETVLSWVGLTYLPQRYWAVAIPVHFCVTLALFAFLFYPGLGLLSNPGLSDQRILVGDSRCINDGIKNGAMPAVTDIPISEVS